MTATNPSPQTPSFDHQSIRAARKAIEDALSGLNLGFELKLGRISFNKDSFGVKLEAKLTSAVAAEKGVAQGLLESACRRYGIDHTEKPVIAGTGEIELVSYNSRAPKYPWNVKHPNGQLYRYPTEMVILYWNGKRETVMAPLFTLKTS